MKNRITSINILAPSKAARHRRAKARIARERQQAQAAENDLAYGSNRAFDCRNGSTPVQDKRNVPQVDFLPACYLWEDCVFRRILAKPRAGIYICAEHPRVLIVAVAEDGTIRTHSDWCCPPIAVAVLAAMECRKGGAA
jgi:hypothetical protein